MCGIAGMIGLEIREDILDSMQKTMYRRGPDGAGRYRCAQGALLHNRLAIIDPANGAQPMLLCWGKERYVIVYNGELYNTQEIKSELTSLGHSFTSHSDTEVLLHAYVQWKEECLHKLNGIFAFAIWEERRQRLFLARDRMGVKPLFYLRHRGGFLFASEIKTILAYPTVEAELDADGVAEIVLFGPGRLPGSGVFHNIFALEPGHFGVLENGNFEAHKYWDVQDKKHGDSFEQTAEKVRYLVEDAIIRQTVSDVPLGTFLSGGLDSSLITAICHNHMQKSGVPLSTFSVDYQDNDRYFVPNKFQPESDGFYINKMRERFGLDHHTTILTPDALESALIDAVKARDLPGMADVDSSLLAFCKDVKKTVKVALSGECADEIFGGYPWYRDADIRAAEGFPWAQNIDQRCGLLSEKFQHCINGREFVMDRYTESLRKADILPETSGLERRMREMTYLNLHWFMQTLLDRKDRMSMYQGLEVRVPFCDYRIAEYLYCVPWTFKDYQNREKGLLRYAMRGLLPEEVLWRKKSPYPKTCDPRYEELVTDKLNVLLRKGDSPLFQILDRQAVYALLSGEHPWPWYGQLMKRPQTIAYVLMIHYWMEHYKVKII